MQETNKYMSLYLLRAAVWLGFLVYEAEWNLTMLLAINAKDHVFP